MMEGVPKHTKTPEEVAEIQQKAKEAVERNKGLVEGPDGLMVVPENTTPEEVAKNTESYQDRIS